MKTHKDKTSDKYLIINENEVKLAPYNNEWINIFANYKEKLEYILQDFSCKIEHVGSTSLNGIKSKPIIDIIIGTKNYDETLHVGKIISQHGWSLEQNPCKYQLIFIKDTIDNTDVAHIYICPIGTARWNSRYYFKKYLLSHNEDLKKYEALKVDLASQYQNDRVLYSKGKREFCDEIHRKAAMLYKYKNDEREIEKLKDIYYDFKNGDNKNEDRKF